LWELYRKQFEVRAMAHEWTEHQKAIKLVLALRAKALEILQNIPECTYGDYYFLANAIELRYGNIYLTQVYQSKLRSRAQRLTEARVRVILLAYLQASEGFFGLLSKTSLMVSEAPIYSRGIVLAVLGILLMLYSLEFKAAKNISCKKDRIREVKIQCQIES